MWYVDWVGALGAFCTTLCFVPQVLLILRTRDTSAISLGMYALFCFGVLCWLIYGLLLVRWPIIIANSVTLVLASTVLVLKWRWG